jgi:hypothetical protein
MYALLGILLRFLHDVHRCRVLGIQWQRGWPLLLAALALIGWIGFRSGGLGVALGLIGIAAILGAGPWLAQRHGYVAFRPEVVPPAAPASPLAPADKVPVRVSGLLGVEGRERVFAELPGYYRTYASREHAVLARKTPRRGRICREDDPAVLGMWYLFITPAALQQVDPGRLYFGRHARPALRLRYRHRDRRGRETNAVAFLSFDDEADRRRVYGDLVSDRDRSW